MSRLPAPGSDIDSWGDILNDFLLVSHNTDGTLKSAAAINGAIQASAVTAKGDLLVATGAGTPARLPIGGNGQVLTANSAQPGGMAWATPTASLVSSTVGTAYPWSQYGLHSVSIDYANSAVTINLAEFVRIFVPAGNPINAIVAMAHTAATGISTGLNSFALYDDTGALITSTPNDAAMWLTAGWIVKVLATPIAAQPADRYVYAALSSAGYATDAGLQFSIVDTAFTDGGGYLVNHRRAFYAFISSWPATINPATFGNSTAGFIPFVGLG
ncbi:MAG TPA: hypothetical protein VLF59_01505 [Candidatus Saccharimonadales bacterium]|nr:hypothetical protein [Candidatus Saccharimonadales bacterium]